MKKQPENKDRQVSQGSPEDDKNSRIDLRKFALFSVVLGELIGYVGAGLGIGYLACTKLGAPWWLLIVTSFGGLSFAFYRIYLISQREL